MKEVADDLKRLFFSQQSDSWLQLQYVLIKQKYRMK